MIKRKLEIAVISDVHLGTYGCQAKQLLTYLNSIEPKKLILNGDIIDIWQFSKHYFPKPHLRVIKKLIDMATEGVEIIYITGNHDELIRKFSGLTIGKISIVDKLVLELDGKSAWFFHGDVFDASLKKTKWIARLGGYGYYLLFSINKFINWAAKKVGREKYSLSKNIKKGGIKHINDFETTVSNLAIKNDYDYVICGHIHQPKQEYKENKYGKTMYLNSGDWVENFTALEYQFKRWKVYHYDKDKLTPFYADEDVKNMDMRDLIAAITIFEPHKET